MVKPSRHHQVFWGSLLVLLLKGMGTALAAPALAIPWDWIYGLQEEAQQRQCTLVGLLRSDPLPAPGGEWQVYSRLDLVATPAQARLTSVLFAENTRTGDLRVLYQAGAATYPLPTGSSPSNWEALEPLDFAMVLPLAWQDRTLLARVYEGWFQTDLSWDRALLWSLPTAATGIPPVHLWDPPPALGYAELLGWDPQAQGRVLFAVADSLEELPRVLSVGSDQQVLLRATGVPFSPPPSSLEGWQKATVAGDPLCYQKNFGLNSGRE